MLKKILVKSTLFFLLVFVCHSNLTSQSKPKRLKYQVNVRGKSLNFRVLHKNEMVKALTKEDFDLYVGGKKTQIDSFDEIRKKINVDVKRKRQNRRLFVLIFNISDYRLNMRDNVDLFFDKILKKGDRLIFISNHFYLKDRVVLNVKAEEMKVKDLLELERIKIRFELTRIKSHLAKLLKDTFDWVSSEQMIQYGRRFFIESYVKYLKKFRHNYLDLDTSQYVDLTQYLASLKMDKWVLCFYHIGGFFRPDKNLKLLVHKDPLFPDLLEQLDKVDKLPERDLSKYFIKSGATLNSIFMKNSSFSDIRLNTGTFYVKFAESDPNTVINPEVIYSISFKYKKIATNSENYFSLATKMSGGLEFSSRKTDEFFSKIVEVEDTMYTISFNVDSDKKIKLVPKNKQYKLLYDNQRISQFTKNIIKERKILNEPQILIDGVHIKKNLLSLTLLNYKLTKIDKDHFGKFKLRLTVFKKHKTLFEKSKVFNTKLDNFELKINLPALPKGDHSIVIEATDLLTNRNDIVVTDI